MTVKGALPVGYAFPWREGTKKWGMLKKSQKINFKSYCADFICVEFLLSDGFAVFTPFLRDECEDIPVICIG